MIKLASASATITASIDSVFLYVSNMENYIHWFPEVVDIRSADKLAHRVVGKKYIETLMLPNGESKLTIEVDRCERPNLFLTKGNLEGILPQMTVLFSEDEKGKCRVDLSYYSRCTDLSEEGGIVNLLQEDLKVKSRKGLEKLKDLLE